LFTTGVKLSRAAGEFVSSFTVKADAKIRFKHVCCALRSHIVLSNQIVQSTVERVHIQTSHCKPFTDTFGCDIGDVDKLCILDI